jgi:uncharacterized protein (TIGR02466 family)
MGGDTLKTINNHSLETFILALKNKDKGRISSNYGGWQSNGLSLQENALKDLIIEIEKSLVSIKKLLCFRKQFKLIVADLWANVSGPGAVNTPHFHTGSVVSGVYYVTFPHNSGKLRFMNPSMDHFAIFPFLGGLEKYAEKTTAFTINHLEFSGKPGELVIFPSHICHYVLPNLSKGERISISFNTKLSKV